MTSWKDKMFISLIYMLLCDTLVCIGSQNSVEMHNFAEAATNDGPPSCDVVGTYRSEHVGSVGRPMMHKHSGSHSTTRWNKFLQASVYTMQSWQRAKTWLFCHSIQFMTRQHRLGRINDVPLYRFLGLVNAAIGELFSFSFSQLAADQ